eukprot:15338625-Ditylum_brightwellii.AAC.1
MKVHPLDMATKGAMGIIGINVTITGNPKRKNTLREQIEANKTILRNLEIKEWRGSSRSTQPKYTDEATLASINNVGVKQKIITLEAGTIVIREMLNKNIHLISAPIDCWLCKGLKRAWQCAPSQCRIKFLQSFQQGKLTVEMKP